VNYAFLALCGAGRIKAVGITKIGYGIFGNGCSSGMKPIAILVISYEGALLSIPIMVIPNRKRQYAY
tara:strand:- start:747 stop:947 length:201 start_codon:yes stop_codon:yes gene_type:complete